MGAASSIARCRPSRRYVDERDLPIVMHLIDNELSEPYSIFTYRYFLHQWPHLCFLAMDGEHCFGEQADVFRAPPCAVSRAAPR